MNNATFQELGLWYRTTKSLIILTKDGEDAITATPEKSENCLITDQCSLLHFICFGEFNPDRADRAFRG